MVVDGRNPIRVEAARKYFEKLIKDEEVFELKKKDTKRTLSQNSYIHYLFSYLSDQTGYGEDEIKVEFFKKKCNPDLFYKEVLNKRGKLVQVLRSSKELSKDEMSLAITRFRNWSASEAEVYLPSSSDLDFIRYCEAELKSIKEYSCL